MNILKLYMQNKNMGETMTAVRIKDGAAVVVTRMSGIQWVDAATGEVYYLHIDIELLY